jgi:hypothetical protein
LGSTQEGAGSFSGILQSTWNPNEERAVSSYDTTQQINVFGVYALPFGRGMKFGTNMNKAADALVGGWQVSGNYRQTSGLPFTCSNGSRWPTDWEVGANCTPTGPVPVSVTNNTTATGSIDKGGGPNLFSNPGAIISTPGEALGVYGLFQETFAGQSGLRDNLRGPGLFNMDSSLFKTFTMPYSEHHKLRLQWDTFNLTNSVNFSGASLTDTSSTTFGRFSNSLIQPRQMQFAGRYTW